MLLITVTPVPQPQYQLSAYALSCIVSEIVNIKKAFP